MSVNPDDMGMASGLAEEYVDLEHQVIRQKVDVDTTGDPDSNVAFELLPGDPGAEFEPGERQLDREEVAQLVYYRRYATVNFLTTADAIDRFEDAFAIVDASVGINGDLFREVTTQSSVTSDPDGQNILIDQGGEIGLLDNYQIYASPQIQSDAVGALGGSFATVSEHVVDYYNWPTGGPIVDSFDTITCGMGGAVSSKSTECQVELRYDFYWDVAEQGRSTNPFGRPSTR
jgi:hypothetical protein